MPVCPAAVRHSGTGIGHGIFRIFPSEPESVDAEGFDG
jgi:hypothetical protein